MWKYGVKEKIQDQYCEFKKLLSVTTKYIHKLITYGAYSRNEMPEIKPHRRTLQSSENSAVRHCLT
jgi:hypothetical protein